MRPSAARQIGKLFRTRSLCNAASRIFPCVVKGKEYNILTAEIARATFGVTPGAHKKRKRLSKVKTGNSLHGHITDPERIFALGTLKKSRAMELKVCLLPHMWRPLPM